MVVSTLKEDNRGEEAATTNGQAESSEKNTYWNLFAQHPNFRWFLASYVVTHIGEWFTYVAALSLLKTAHEDSQLLISLLIVVRMAPNTLFSFPGGFLADCCNRKHVMVTIDLLSAVVALTYLPAVDHDYRWIFLCTVLQETLSGLYEPSRSAILPLLFGKEGKDDDFLDKANEVAAASWSLTAAVGSGLGGWVVAQYGPKACFFSDCVLYVVSAALMQFGVHGSFNVTELGEEASSSENPAPSTSWTMLAELVAYLRSPKGVFVLFKCCGAFLFGASDVIQVFFATREDGHLDSERLGWLFGAVGVGCLVGSISLPEKRSYIVSIISAYALVGVGFGMLGVSHHFWVQFLFTIPRSAGAAILWIDSSILLQRETAITLLGRVSAIDNALALFGEAMSAVVAGYMQDVYGWSGYAVSELLGGMALAMSAAWAAWYYLCYLKSFPRSAADQSDDVEMEPLRSLEATEEPISDG